MIYLSICNIQMYYLYQNNYAKPKCFTGAKILIIFVRTAHWMTYFDFSKSKLSLKLMKAFEY